jgi:hypothetical protein
MIRYSRLTVAVLVVIGQTERRPRVACGEDGAPHVCGEERHVAEILQALR